MGVWLLGGHVLRLGGWTEQPGRKLDPRPWRVMGMEACGVSVCVGAISRFLCTDEARDTGA